MDRLARVTGVLAALLCGVLAGRVLWSPLPADRVVGSRLPTMLAAEGAGIACAAAVAVLVTAALTRRRSITLTTVVAVAGLLLLALPEAVRYPSEPTVLMYSNALAAALILGAAAPPAARHPGAQAGLAAGMLGAFLLAEGVDLQRLWSGQEGWTAYAPLTSWETTGLVASWIPVAAAAVVVVGALLDRRTSWTARIDSRLILTTAALPVVAFAAAWLLLGADADARPALWLAYVVPLVAVVAWTAWRLPGRDGRVLFAGTAIVAAATGGTPGAGADWWVLLIPAALVAGGVVLGLRLPAPPVGFGLLALTAAAVLVTQEPWDVVPAIGLTFALPLAAGYVVGSCLPTSAPAATVGFSLPFTVGVPGVAAAAWTVGSRYADYQPAPVLDWPDTVSVGPVAVAVAVIVVCGVGAWGLDLRSGAR